MLHALVIIRHTGLQALDSTHIWMVRHKPHELQHLIALIESPHLMALELLYWPAYFTPVTTTTPDFVTTELMTKRSKLMGMVNDQSLWAW